VSLAASPSWFVYSRPGCGLCEQFLLDLAALMGDRASRVRVVDIDGDPELCRKYSDRIPVLAIDGDFVCAYRLDEGRVRRYMSAEQ
jgi:hypothetical protein